VHSPKRSGTHVLVGACNFKFACSTLSHSPLNLSKSHFTLLPSNCYRATRDDFPHARITVAYHHGLMRTEPNDFSDSGVTHHFHTLGRAGQRLDKGNGILGKSRSDSQSTVPQSPRPNRGLLLHTYVSDTGRGMMQEAVMRTIAIGLVALFLSTFGASAGTWCAHLAVPPGSTSCSFYSMQQCQATVSGVGGFCAPNPFAAYAAEPRRHYRRHHR
jgi:hypothetical protein